MRRELKDDDLSGKQYCFVTVAKHIPMRRELKVHNPTELGAILMESQSTSR